MCCAGNRSHYLLTETACPCFRNTSEARWEHGCTFNVHLYLQCIYIVLLYIYIVNLYLHCIINVHLCNTNYICLIRRVNFLLTSFTTPVALQKLYLTFMYGMILQWSEFWPCPFLIILTSFWNLTVVCLTVNEIGFSCGSEIYALTYYSSLGNRSWFFNLLLTTLSYQVAEVSCLFRKML